MKWNGDFTIAAGNGTFGSASNQLKTVNNFFIGENDDLYVVDTGNYRIQKYTANSINGITVAGTTGVIGTNASLLYNPMCIYVGANKNMYISDIIAPRILVWPEGATSSTTVLPGSTTLGIIYDIDGDSNGNIYALSYTDGQVVMWTPSATNYTILTVGSTVGVSISQLYYPQAITVDAVNQIIYIALYSLNTIVAWPFYATSGRIIAGKNVTADSANWLLNYPYDVMHDINGNLYVADNNNHRIVLFCQNPPSTNGTPLINYNLYNPSRMTMDSKLNIYVYETGSYRVKKFARIT